MKICIDARVLDKGITGVGVFLNSFLTDLLLTDTVNEYLIISNTYKAPKDVHKVIKHNTWNLPVKIGAFFWLNIALPKILKENKVDLLFAPNMIIPLNKPKNVKTIIVVHDVFHKINPSYHPLSYRLYLNFVLGRSLSNATHVLTVSENSKKDIVRFFNVSNEKISVIWQVPDESFNSLEEPEATVQRIKTKYGVVGNSLLYVGLVETRKNVLGILQISDKLIERGIDHKVFLIGKPGHGYKNIFPEIEKRKKRIVHLQDLSFAELKIIYKTCKVFIYPSFYEGFGRPLIEAMKSGLPVVASNSSAIPEVLNNAGIMHNPEAYDDFTDSIIKLLNDNELAQKVKYKGLKRAEFFRKDKLIEKKLEVFNSLVN